MENFPWHQSANLGYSSRRTNRDELMQLAGGRGEYVWYSPNDYEVEKHFQNGKGRTNEGACS